MLVGLRSSRPLIRAGLSAAHSSGRTSLRCCAQPLTMSRSQSTFPTYLVTPSQLNQALQTSKADEESSKPRVIPICGSWFLPNDPEKRTGYQVYTEARIPGARFFDLDAVSDTTSPFPHMLPSNDVFRRAMSKIGLHKEDTLVVYDTKELGIFSAPRVAWTLKAFGHPSVHILNNFRLYVQQGYATESGEPSEPQPTDYPHAELDHSQVVDFEEMKLITSEHVKEDGKTQILDARSSGRWKGTEPEPRPGLSSGHMPGSISVPVPELLDPDSKAFLPSKQLEKVFEKLGVDPTKPIVSSCGTGVTAAVIETALIEAKWASEVRRVYDGSWTEWAQRVQPHENLIVKSS